MIKKILNALNRALSSEMKYEQPKSYDTSNNKPAPDPMTKADIAIRNRFEKTEKAGKLGLGFGGEDTKPKRAPAVMGIGKRIIK